MSHTEFKDLPLIDPIQRALAEKGYAEPSPIQAQAIPIILEGKDVIGASQTGTGKTAAFALPSLSRIEKLGKPQILVLEPTRELAHQVAEQFHYVQSKYVAMQAMKDSAQSARRWMIANYTDFEAGLEEAEKILTAMQAYVLAYAEYLKIVNEYNNHVAKLNSVSGVYE